MYELLFTLFPKMNLFWTSEAKVTKMLKTFKVQTC